MNENKKKIYDGVDYGVNTWFSRGSIRLLGKFSVTGAKISGDRVINVGTGSEVSTILTIGGENSGSGVLVPEGVNTTENQTNKITLTYNIEWKEENNTFLAEGTEGKLTISTSNYFIGDQSIPSMDNSLIKISISQYKNNLTLGTEEDNTDVTLTITMEMPKDKDQYDVYAGKQFKFTLNVGIEAPQTNQE